MKVRLRFSDGKPESIIQINQRIKNADQSDPDLDEEEQKFWQMLQTTDTFLMKTGPWLYFAEIIALALGIVLSIIIIIIIIFICIKRRRYTNAQALALKVKQEEKERRELERQQKEEDEYIDEDDEDESDDYYDDLLMIDKLKDNYSVEIGKSGVINKIHLDLKDIDKTDLDLKDQRLLRHHFFLLLTLLHPINKFFKLNRI
ncbi:MAG: hypothetical protein EZS28_013609 [Streblomastix strix]|uniref:Uncharacterized protein n=1 Tax=Streblomastix strix TaxID=222440 RepID=A0A5J4W8D6_9EUKA|nr:MAG: hypothetical protein EZS28_013609 [Streblomastix strix]